MVTFIAKNKHYILDFLQIGLFFLLGLKIAKVEIVVSILLFLLVSVRFILQNNTSSIKEIGKKELIDLAALASFMVSVVLFKTIFDGASSIFENAFHFIFLIVVFFVSSRVTETKYGFDGLSPLIAYFIGSFLFISLTSGVTFADFGIKSNVRLYIDCWTREYISCTLASLYLLPLTVLFVFAFVYFLNKKQYLISLLSLLPVALSLYVSYRFGNRGYFVALFIACFIICIFTNLELDSKKHKKYDLLLYVPLALVSLSCIFLIIAFLNVFGVGDILKSNPFFERILTRGSDESRKQIYVDFFTNFWKYPFGGMIQSEAIGSGRYVHNAFLDMYGNAGIIPLIFFVYFFVRFVISVYVKKIYKGQIIKFLVINSFLVSIFAISLFEPVFDANGYYFASMFGIFSIVSRDNPVNYHKKPVEAKGKEEKNEEPVAEVKKETKSKPATKQVSAPKKIKKTKPIAKKKSAITKTQNKATVKKSTAKPNAVKKTPKTKNGSKTTN